MSQASMDAWEELPGLGFNTQKNRRRRHRKRGNRALAAKAAAGAGAVEPTVTETPSATAAPDEGEITLGQTEDLEIETESSEGGSENFRLQTLQTSVVGSSNKEVDLQKKAPCTQREASLTLPILLPNTHLPNTIMANEASELTHLQERITQLSRENFALITQNEVLEKNYVDLESKFTAEEAAHASTNHKLQEEIDHHRVARDSLATAHLDLKADREDLGRARTRIEELEEIEGALAGRIGVLNGLVSRYMKDNSDARDRALDQDRDNKGLSTQLEEVNAEAMSLKAQIEVLQSHVADFDLIAQELQDERAAADGIRQQLDKMQSDAAARFPLDPLAFQNTSSDAREATSPSPSESDLQPSQNLGAELAGLGIETSPISTHSRSKRSASFGENFTSEHEFEHGANLVVSTVQTVYDQAPDAFIAVGNYESSSTQTLPPPNALTRPVTVIDVKPEPAPLHCVGLSSVFTVVSQEPEAEIHAESPSQGEAERIVIFQDREVYICRDVRVAHHSSNHNALKCWISADLEFFALLFLLLTSVLGAMGQSLRGVFGLVSSNVHSSNSPSPLGMKADSKNATTDESTGKASAHDDDAGRPQVTFINEEGVRSPPETFDTPDGLGAILDREYERVDARAGGDALSRRQVRENRKSNAARTIATFAQHCLFYVILIIALLTLVERKNWIDANEKTRAVFSGLLADRSNVSQYSVTDLRLWVPERWSAGFHMGLLNTAQYFEYELVALPTPG